ncbi:MAG TPA: ferric reductase-like transmembrane domain-containing protein [Ktedonobacterales bacterium]|nr:ferric reductase-like transmembrane domain-containing protein [Ktedonobacterales bacterium]
MMTQGWLLHTPVAVAGTRLVAQLVASRAVTSPTLWYLTRALAVGAYVALTVSMLFGALRSIARQSRERVSWAMDELHQFLAALAAVLVLGHLVTLLLDPFLPFTLPNLLLPLREPYRPLAVILGVYALYTLVALLLTSWFRAFMPYSFWRALHYLSFVAFILVTAHGLLAGSDAGEPWMRALYAGSAGAFAFVSLIRLLGGARKSSPSSQLNGA